MATDDATTQTAKPTSPNDAKKTEKVPFFVARMWQGMTLPIWLRMLKQHRFAVAPSRLPLALRITMFSLVNTGLSWWEKFLYGERIRAAQLKHPPLFVIGHWRTGTTWLHELLAQDERFSYPTTYQCMAPHHFVSTQDIAPKLMPHLLPAQRPMDNMAVSWDRPQEDEFALCNLGAPSPYLRWGFPNTPGSYDNFLELHDVTPRERKQWQLTLKRFLEHMSFRDPRRVVLKSPTHTARVGPILETFPDAQFIHIVRDPYVVFPSTVKTWKRLWNMMGLHSPNYEGVEEYVFEGLIRMYRRFNEDKQRLKPSQICEVRYEDLRANLLEEMRRIYDHLQLGDFRRVEPKLQKYVEATKDYKTNVFDQPDGLRQQIGERWNDYIRQYGYDVV